MFETLSARWRLRPIRNCPGRYVLLDAPPELDPDALLGGRVATHRFRSPAARDLVVAAYFGPGGLISYGRGDGYLHTLNTEEGFWRKLALLGIELPAQGESHALGDCQR
ncbi:MAG TPA: hypothetical protein VD886_23225 [Herpetosiphonaceae bacterium]|nr:hypothetical protein [Herpetosiphonaceae bacterium]